MGSPRQLENAVPTSKNPHGVWVWSRSYMKKKSCNVTCKLHCNFVLCNSRFNCDGLKSEIRFTIFLIATIIYHHTKPVLQFEIVFFLLSNLFPYKLCLQKMTYQKNEKCYQFFRSNHNLWHLKKKRKIFTNMSQISNLP